MSDACPTCLHYTLLLITGRDLDARRTAIRELAAHLTDHAERRTA